MSIQKGFYFFEKGATVIFVKIIPDFKYEIECGHRIVAGVDEAGRGPGAGGVFAGAVFGQIGAGVFPAEAILKGLK